MEENFPENIEDSARSGGRNKKLIKIKSHLEIANRRSVNQSETKLSSPQKSKRMASDMLLDQSPPINENKSVAGTRQVDFAVLNSFHDANEIQKLKHDESTDSDKHGNTHDKLPAIESSSPHENRSQNELSNLIYKEI